MHQKALSFQDDSTQAVSGKLGAVQYRPTAVNRSRENGGRENAGRVDGKSVSQQVIALYRAVTEDFRGESGTGECSSRRIWRTGWDSNPRYPCRYAAFRVRCLQPLDHPSDAAASTTARRRSGAETSVWSRPPQDHLCSRGAISGEAFRSTPPGPASPSRRSRSLDRRTVLRSSAARPMETYSIFLESIRRIRNPQSPC